MKEKNYERIALKKTDISKIDRWIEQIKMECPGIPLSRGAVLSWLISNHAEVLRPNEMKQLREMHFDDVKYAKWLVRQLEVARKNGDSAKLQDFLPSRQPKPRRETNEKVDENL